MYQPDLGRWFNVDPLAGEYMQYSPYHYVYNNPINYIDPDGRQIDPVITDNGVDENGIQQYSVKFNISIKVLNNSGTSIDMNAFKKQLRSDLKNAFSGSYSAGKVAYTFEAGDIDVQDVNNMDQVADSDHVLTIVDDVTGKAIDKDGNVREAGGKGEFGMKNIWTEPSSDISYLSERSIHELGHSGRLEHSWDTASSDDDNSQNYLSYDRDCPCEFTGRQLLIITNAGKNGRLNQGNNYSRAPEMERIQKTTDLKPNANVYKGQKIPRPVGSQ